MVPKTWVSERETSPQPSLSSSVNQNSSSAPSTLSSIISSDKPPRSQSPNGRLSQPLAPPGRSATSSPAPPQIEDIRSLIIRAFSPAVGIYASADTELLIRRKGFNDGFRQMVRSFGENVMGKVVIRDSVGAGRGWDDYGVRFVELGDLAGKADANLKEKAGNSLLDEVLDRCLDGEDALSHSDLTAYASASGHPPPASPFYKMFLRRLLSASTMTPHETFRHPVACVIAISSRNSNPIETLRQLYANTSQGDKKLPVWADMDYLRYYVLVHDEDRDEITKSKALFDQMKRHFGLHCHLLRLRSEQCVPTDDDSTLLPPSEWVTPLEELVESDNQGMCVGPSKISLYSCFLQI